MNEERCPDCGGPFEAHNAVNEVPDGLVAHSADGGACWRSVNTPFVHHLFAWMQRAARKGPAMQREAERQARMVARWPADMQPARDDPLPGSQEEWW